MNALVSAFRNSTSKTRAAGTGAATAGVFSTFVVWIAQVFVYHNQAVPAPLIGVIVTVCGAVGAFAAAYMKAMSAEDLAKIADQHGVVLTAAPPDPPGPLVPVNPDKAA